MDGFEELPPDVKLDHEVAPEQAAPAQWSKAEEQQIVRYAQTAKSPEDLASFASNLNPNVSLTPEHAKAIIDHRDAYGDVSSKFTAPEGGHVDEVPEGFDAVPADAKIDYGTKSGLSPDEIKAQVEKLPEFLRPGLTDIAGSSYTAGLDNEGAGIASAIGSMLLHPEESVRSHGQNIADAYHAGRTNALMMDDYARLQNPNLATAAEIGGAIANPLARLGSGVQGAIRSGAAFGGVTGFEGSNGTIEERLGEAGKDAAIGAVAAPVIGAALHVPGAIAGTVKSVMGGSPGLARRIVAKALKADANTGAGVGSEMASAQANDVPYMLADSGDNARGTLAAAVRSPGPARTLARDALEQRQSGLPERVTNAIERDLGPVSNPHQVADTLMTKARNESAPLYERFYGAQPVSSPAIDALITRPSVQKALKNAYQIAKEEDVDPHALGLVLDADGNVTLKATPRSAEDIDAANASRYPKAEVPEHGDEFLHLAVRRIRTKNGRTVPIRGPLDITQTLRAMGGVKDAGGDLAHIGITNAPRRMAFGSNEHFLGHLIDNEHGIPLDDATHAIWEAGLMPDVTDRPMIEDLVDRLHQEHIGANRFFHPDDLEEVQRFEQGQQNRARADELRTEGIVDDASSHAAGPRPGTDWGPKVAPTYSPQTLDYIKRGLDDVVEKYRDSTTGRLNLNTEGRAVNHTLRAFISAVDKQFPDYAAARSAYGGPVRGIDAMNQGRKALNMTADDLEARIRDMSPFEKQMFAFGHRRAMAELVHSKGDSANVINAIAGTGKKRAMLARLHGDRPSFQRFVETLGQEKEGFNTFARSTLGSPTAINLQDDAALNMATMAADMITTGLPIGTAIRQAAKFGIGKIGAETRKHVAALLSETDPAAFQKLAAELRQEAARRGLKHGKVARIGVRSSQGITAALTSQPSQ